MPIIIGLFVAGMVPALLVWRLTQRSVPAKAATLRAACVSLCFVPTLAPFVQGASTVPAWFVLLFGWADMRARGIAAALALPLIAFFVIRSWMKGVLEREAGASSDS